MSASQFYKRRVPRANVNDRIPAVYINCPKLNPRPIRVLTIAEYGAAIKPDDLISIPKFFESLDGTLEVGRTTAPVKLRLVYLQPNLAGIEFMETPELIRGAIRLFFQSELMGASMKLTHFFMPSSGTGLDRRGTLRYSDGKSNIFEVSFKDGHVESFILSLSHFGKMIEWSRDLKQFLVQDFYRKQLVRFVKNLPHLDQGFVKELEEIFVTSKDF